MPVKKKFIFTLIAAAFVLLCSVMNVFTQNDFVKNTDTKVDEYMRELVKQNRFSGSVLVAKDGKIISRHSYGMADIEAGLPNTLKTKFRTGAVSDQIKAAAVMKLREEGKLDVYDKINKYLDGCPESWDFISVEQLLRHSSGIPDYTDFPELKEISSGKIAFSGILALFKDKPLLFSYGTENRYSNSNYLLISLIIEKVSDMPYEDYMNTKIFRPLGMKNTGFAYQGKPVKGLAKGCDFNGKKYIKTELQDILAPYSNSSIYSTVEDLFIWEQSLYSEKIISKPSADIIYLPDTRGYTFGSVSGNFYKKMIFIGGIVPGFSSHYARFPNENAYIVMLSNLDKKSCPFNTTNLDISAIIFGEKYKLPEEKKYTKVDRSILSNYTGEYSIEHVRSPSELKFTVSIDSGMLYITAPSKVKYEIIPVSETRFYIPEPEAEIEFVTDSNGSVTLMVLYIIGRETPLRVCRKKSSEVKPAVYDKTLNDKLSSHGFEPEGIINLLKLVDNETYRKVHSLIIMRGGDVILEKYFNGYCATDAHMTTSVNKSFISALIGIAIEKGFINNADQKILSFFPQYSSIENLDDNKKNIRIQDILTLRSGVDFHDGSSGMPSPIDLLISDWDRYYLNRPMADQPGTSFHYESGGILVLSAILKNSCGLLADKFADKWLFPKLGISGSYWLKNREDHPNSLYMKPIDMAKFGQLYLQKGMWNGEQVIPAAWVEDSFKMHVDFGSNEDRFWGPYTRGYGYLWWILKPGKEKGTQYIYTARGAMGQRIFVVPEYDMVVVVTAGDEMSGEFMLYERIIPAIRE